MPGRCGSLSVGDQNFFNFDLEIHSALFYECGSPDCVWTEQFLTSISGKLDIARRVKSEMAGDELGLAANSDALKWMPWRCARARSLSIGHENTFQFFNFDLELRSGMFYECGSPNSIWTYRCLASISGKLDIARSVNSKMAGDELG